MSRPEVNRQASSRTKGATSARSGAEESHTLPQRLTFPKAKAIAADLRAAQSSFLSGEITRDFLAQAGEPLLGIRVLEVVANLSADCGTYYLTCPNATQDPNNCPTVAKGSAESCCLCTGLGYPRCPNDPQPVPRPKDGGTDSTDDDSAGGDSSNDAGGYGSDDSSGGYGSDDSTGGYSSDDAGGYGSDDSAGGSDDSSGGYGSDDSSGDSDN